MSNKFPPANAAEVWFIGRLLAGFCILAGLIGALFGDWSGIPIGLFVLAWAWREAHQPKTN